MLARDVLCRAIHYPKFITPAGVFDEELLLKFDKASEGGVYAMSVASQFLCKNLAGIHEYGCDAADMKNERFRNAQGRDPEPLREEVHYIGFYEVFYGDILSLTLDYYTASCFWLPENGQDVHFQVQFDPKKSQGSKSQLRNDRRAAIGILFTMLKGPMRFIAAKDEPNRAELEAIDLPEIDRPNSTLVA